MKRPISTRIKRIYKEIRKNWKDRCWWKGRIIYYYNTNLRQNNGIFVMNEDWDNLIILDACRYDTFREVACVDVDYRISRGSSTDEFLKENFANNKYDDVIYVTANPYVNMICKGSFYKIISVWKHAWNDEIGTVLPETVVKYALEVEKEHPDKRLIIHFLQPHYPFIGNPEIGGRKERAFNTDKYIYNPFIEVQKGNLKLEEVYKAYKRNLEIVLPHAFYLARKLKGKSIITADHGEAFNDWAFPLPFRVLAHPSYTHIPALVKVPWLVFESKERKEIRKGDEKQRLKEKIKRLRERGRV